MARVSKGNSLSSPVLQPGWTIEDDGYGLLTCSATFKVRHGSSTGTPGTGKAALGSAPARGDAFVQDPRLQCHRSTSVMDANGIQVITADYVGIAKGSSTAPNVSGRYSSNQEPISTHPKFAEFGGTQPAPINGAVFNDDGSFKRFADPAYDEYYGITSYLACGFAITGTIYSSDFATLATLKECVGTTSGTGIWADINLLGELNKLGAGGPGWTGVPVWQDGRERDQLLLSGLACEYYGRILKISYDIMYSQDGWNSSIYNSRSSVVQTTGNKKSTWNGKGSLNLGAAFNSTRNVFGR